ncbi:hypothetical protein EYF80_023421 [Liparis tanakae]|uniref:Uncharacterized protein n=1 Tax=Liparis tanakae TaxID=230148 RepID=A0A4Z2HNP0_9TELE|nr:hypothetical protein EYF80_023421 [Liparis tanakae]
MITNIHHILLHVRLAQQTFWERISARQPHLFSCWVRRFWAARSLSRLGTLSSCCSSWISSRWLAMAEDVRAEG